MTFECVTSGFVEHSGVVQGYLAHKNPPPPQNPTVALYLGTYGGPRGVGVSYERGTHVRLDRQLALRREIVVWGLEFLGRVEDLGFGVEG